MVTADNLLEFLREVDPFKTLPADQLRLLNSSASVSEYEKGETIYTEGGHADSVLILFEGLVEIFKYSSAGRPMAIEIIRPKELFGTLCRIGTDSHSFPCTAIGAAKSRVIRIPDKVFSDLYRRFPSMAISVCVLCSLRLNAVQGISSQVQEPVHKRIAAALLRLMVTDGKTLDFTRREIAELASTTVETAIRTLSSFSKKGWVTSTRGRIVIETPNELKKLLQAC